MANPTYQGNFCTVWLANAAGTLTEISPYVISVEPVRSNEAADFTALQAGGGPITRNIRRGAGQSEFQLKCLYDPVLAKILRQLVAARSGGQLQVRYGANAAPTVGDVIFSGTFTIFGVHLTYNPGQNATLDVDVKPSDGGTIIPAFGIN